MLIAVLVLGLFSGCSSPGNARSLVVAVSAAPCFKILNYVKSNLESQGYSLQIKVFDSYSDAHAAVKNGDADACYASHKPYLDVFNAEHGSNLTSAAAIHFEPMGIYKGIKSSLSSLSPRDIILIPNDGANRTRALRFLEEQGVILIEDDAPEVLTLKDIEAYDVSVEIREMELSKIAAERSAVALCIIPSDCALQVGINPRLDALVIENPQSPSATTYATVLAIRPGYEYALKIQALITALQSDGVAEYFSTFYQGALFFPAQQ